MPNYERTRRRFLHAICEIQNSKFRIQNFMTPWFLDGFVILLYFVIVISIGLYKGRGDRTMEGFAVGDRNIPWWAVLASILAAEISAATFLGAPGEGYALRNFTYAQLAIGTIIARVIVSFVFIKPYYDYRVVP